MINSIIGQNPDVLIPIYIKDWYILHNKDGDKPFAPGMSALEKKADLKNYLLIKLPNAIELIDEQIKKIADNIGYENDDFSYGGRRNKKTMKNIKRIKNKKTMKHIKRIKTSKRKIIKKKKTRRKIQSQ